MLPSRQKQRCTGTDVPHCDWGHVSAPGSREIGKWASRAAQAEVSSDLGYCRDWFKVASRNWEGAEQDAGWAGGQGGRGAPAHGYTPARHDIIGCSSLPPSTTSFPSNRNRLFLFCTTWTSPGGRPSCLGPKQPKQPRESSVSSPLETENIARHQSVQNQSRPAIWPSDQRRRAETCSCRYPMFHVPAAPECSSAHLPAHTPAHLPAHRGRPQRPGRSWGWFVSARSLALPHMHHRIVNVSPSKLYV